MDKLWSPWRSQYIQSFKDEPETDSDSSLFTRILKQDKDKENYILHRGKHCFIIMNLYPYNSGHLMIVPYKEAKSISELNGDERLELMEFIDMGCKVLTDALKPHGFNIGANLGRTAGAGIENHIHFHIVPRWNGDTNFMPILSEIKVISEAMDETYEKLKKSFNKLQK